MDVAYRKRPIIYYQFDNEEFRKVHLSEGYFKYENDGSTDNTLSICQEIKDNRIRIINQGNKGLSLSRNVGIDNSNGEYLFFIDVDDWIDEDTIEYLYKHISYNMGFHHRKQHLPIEYK